MITLKAEEEGARQERHFRPGHLCLSCGLFASPHRLLMPAEKKRRLNEGVMLLESKKSVNKPHSLF